jgi:hypothetical protein
MLTPRQRGVKKKSILTIFQDDRGSLCCALIKQTRSFPLIPRNERYTPLMVFEITSEVI